jgi:four helix bundle protein
MANIRGTCLAAVNRGALGAGEAGALTRRGAAGKLRIIGLTSQIRRAALSAPTNIAEGSAKRGPAEFRRFLDYSLGSLSELAYLLRFAHDTQFLTDEAWTRLHQMRDKAAILTWRLARSMATSK